VNRLTIRPKKSLGQNFLVDNNVVRKIIEAIDPNPDDVFIEIGPGFGVLTEYLVLKAGRVIAIEIDRRLADRLRHRFQTGTLELCQADFLKTDLVGLAAGATVRIAGNIPYHITSPVIFRVFDFRHCVHDMTLMIQREVAERIVAETRTKAYGILSVYSQLYSRPKILFTVSRHVFRPKPEVDSAVVRWDFREGETKVPLNPELMDKVIHLAFQQRRKMLRRSLKQLEGFDSVSAFLPFDFTRRPEELEPLDFLELSNTIHLAWKN
jgi:16S rRNA (adenine1518-N6/adenine1519-N6)-dimethyltransferase